MTPQESTTKDVKPFNVDLKLFSNYLMLFFLQRDMNRQVKDLNRIREERTSFKREYSLVMSERDAVHREMDKLQDDLTLKQKEKWANFWIF